MDDIECDDVDEFADNDERIEGTDDIARKVSRNSGKNEATALNHFKRFMETMDAKQKFPMLSDMNADSISRTIIHLLCCDVQLAS